MITVYTKAKCPKCKVLKTKLSQKGIEYTEVTDVDTMVEMDIQEVPMMQIDEESPLTFGEAVRKVNSF